MKIKNNFTSSSRSTEFAQFTSCFLPVLNIKHDAKPDAAVNLTWKSAGKTDQTFPTKTLRTVIKV